MMQNMCILYVMWYFTRAYRNAILSFAIFILTSYPLFIRISRTSISSSSAAQWTGLFPHCSTKFLLVTLTSSSITLVQRKEQRQQLIRWKVLRVWDRFIFLTRVSPFGTPCESEINFHNSECEDRLHVSTTWSRSPHEILYMPRIVETQLYLTHKDSDRHLQSKG